MPVVLAMPPERDDADGILQHVIVVGQLHRTTRRGGRWKKADMLGVLVHDILVETEVKLVCTCASGEVWLQSIAEAHPLRSHMFHESHAT